MAEAQAKTQYYRNRFKELRDEQENEGWIGHWKDLVDFIAPECGRYLNENVGTKTDGAKKRGKIINAEATEDLRILASGLQSGLTSPSRPWFRLNVEDKELSEVRPVREWLDRLRDLFMAIFNKSNFYQSAFNVYYELGGFGTNAMIIEEDFLNGIRCRPFTIGEFMIGLNERYEVDSLYRPLSLSTKQIIEMFGEKNVSEAVRSAYQNRQLGTRWEVCHAIQPNRLFKFGDAGVRGKSFESIYWEVGGDPDKFLKTGGYRSRSFIAPRWVTRGVSTYGYSPSMTALGDVKMLQKMEEKKLKALDKSVDPPMNAPASMKGKGGTILPGGVNYIDVHQGQQGFTPAYQINPDFQKIAFELDRVERRLRRFFYTDLFLAVINEEKKMTAFEVAKRYEEKLIVLGPALEKLQTEFLKPVIERTYEIIDHLGFFEPGSYYQPPEELNGQEIKIEYISLLAQAQKLVEVGSIEQAVVFTVNLAQANPAVLDKIDFDQVVDVYGDALGTPQGVIRSDEEVEEVRAAKAQQQQMQAMAAMAPAAKDIAGAFKSAGETEVNGKNLLEQAAGAGQ